MADMTVIAIFGIVRFMEFFELHLLLLSVKLLYSFKCCWEGDRKERDEDMIL
jgi:hypothetical protein